MQKNDKQKLKTQLEQEAKKLLSAEGDELTILLLSTCGALLKMSEKTIDMEHVSDEVLAVYMSFAKRIQTFYDLYAGNRNEVEEQKKRNDEVLASLNQRKEILDELRATQKEMLAEEQQTKDELAAVKNSIAAIPEELKDLRSEYKEREALLKELQNAATEYSPEKQAELQKKIDELIPVVEENKVATENLRNRKESLEKQDTKYDSERQTLTTNLIEIITTSMDQLKSDMKEHAEFLDNTERSAEALAQSLSACQRKREEFSHWFEEEETPLEAMMAELGHPENVELRETLNIGQVKIVKNAMEDVQKNLSMLDQILSACAAAAEKDLQIIKRRAGQLR